MNPNHHFTRHALAMRLHLSHDNERLREALRTILDLAEFSTSAMIQQDVARIARNALIPVNPPNPAIMHGQ